MLYNQNIIGYCTVEFIVSNADPHIANAETVFWAIDLKFGLTDQITTYKFCELVANQSRMIIKSGTKTNSNFNKDWNTEQTYFSIPNIIDQTIGDLKMAEIINRFRISSLVYDFDRSNGVLFSLPDLLQCCMFGLMGIGNHRGDLIKILEDCISLLKSNVSSIYFIYLIK